MLSTLGQARGSHSPRVLGQYLPLAQEVVTAGQDDTWGWKLISKESVVAKASFSDVGFGVRDQSPFQKEEVWWRELSS